MGADRSSALQTFAADLRKVRASAGIEWRSQRSFSRIAQWMKRDSAPSTMLILLDACGVDAAARSAWLRALDAVADVGRYVRLVGHDLVPHPDLDNATHRCAATVCLLTHGANKPRAWIIARDDMPDRTNATTVVDRVLRHMRRWVDDAPGQLSVKAFFRELLRALKVAIGRLLRARLHYRAETQPDALSHQHSVDQCRPRGPNPSRNRRLSTLTFRELQPV